LNDKTIATDSGIDKVNQIKTKVPELFQINKIKEAYPLSYMESMNSVLTQEVEKYNLLLDRI